MDATLEKPQVAEDIWGFYLVDRAAEVPCETLGRFMALLASKSTDRAAIDMQKTDMVKGTVPVTLYGPVCENANMPDAEEFEGRLIAHYTLERALINGGTSAVERDLPTFGMNKEEKKELARLLKLKTGGKVGGALRNLNLERV